MMQRLLIRGFNDTLDKNDSIYFGLSNRPALKRLMGFLLQPQV